MKIMALSVIGLCAWATVVSSAASDAHAKKLALAVHLASGGPNWARVKTVRFTFNVEKDGKILISASHVWDVRAETDTVTWDGRTVTVNIRNPDRDEYAQAAYARWVNDSYWLLAPLKLFDPDVHLDYTGPHTIRGRSYESLFLTHGDVGLTPRDKYKFYIDPQTHLVAYWCYMPAVPREGGAHITCGSWRGYQDFGGLTLSTERQFGDRRIWFSDISVERD
jgi:hypothetical protein